MKARAPAMTKVKIAPINRASAEGTLKMSIPLTIALTKGSELALIVKSGLKEIWSRKIDLTLDLNVLDWVLRFHRST